jgi:hypothetical protein
LEGGKQARGQEEERFQAPCQSGRKESAFSKDVARCGAGIAEGQAAFQAAEQGQWQAKPFN